MPAPGGAGRLSALLWETVSSDVLVLPLFVSFRLLSKMLRQEYKRDKKRPKESAKGDRFPHGPVSVSPPRALLSYAKAYRRNNSLQNSRRRAPHHDCLIATTRQGTWQGWQMPPTPHCGACRPVSIPLPQTSKSSINYAILRPLCCPALPPRLCLTRTVRDFRRRRAMFDHPSTKWRTLCHLVQAPASGGR